MIRKIKFSNFYSFYKEQEISFLAKKKKTYDYYKSKSDDQITKVVGLVGGNGSGKTNVMRFFSFLSYFVCRKINDEPQRTSEIVYKTFFNNDEISSFYIEFEKENLIFFYDFSIKKNIIIKESLKIKEMKNESAMIKVFSRRLNAIELLNNDYFKNLTKDILPEIREDVSFIAFIKKSIYNVDIINKIYNYFLEFKTNIDEKGIINNPMHQLDVLNVYLSDPDLKKEAEDFICHFDIGLNGFEIKKEIKTEKKEVYISVQGIHSTRAKNNKLDFNYESRGTRALFFVLANILSALKNNSIVIIDEIEAGFHPEALVKIINYFIHEGKDKSTQIIFSSNSHSFMNKLDMHQIFLVEKNDQGESSVIRLNEIKDIRSDENFLAKYMTGSYGAFPKIRV